MLQGITKVNCTMGSKGKSGTGNKEKYMVYEVINISFVHGYGGHVGIGG